MLVIKFVNMFFRTASVFQGEFESPLDFAQCTALPVFAPSLVVHFKVFIGANFQQLGLFGSSKIWDDLSFHLFCGYRVQPPLPVAAVCRLRPALLTTGRRPRPNPPPSLACQKRFDLSNLLFFTSAILYL